MKIIDFGIAGRNWGQHSNDESRAGTVKYMAPELLAGTDCKAHPFLDTWALGIMTYFMATGEYPWKSTNARELLSAIDS